jgi:hypothetical protein
MQNLKTRHLSVIAACTIIPLQLFLAFGFTFTAAKNISAWHWAFVWSTFLLNIPALILTWFFPRSGSYWVLGNTIISLAIASGFLWNSHFEAKSYGGSLLSALSMAPIRAMVMASFLWLPQLIFGGAMLYRVSCEKRQAPVSR